MRSALVLVQMLGVLFGGCESGPLFQPDPFHLAIIRQYVDETGSYETHFPVETVCLTPSEPLCYCRPDNRGRALAGLPRGERVNLSTATLDELTLLPGIGPGLARRIVVFRKEFGFHDVADLLDVNGIGAGRFERIASLVWVGQ